jgi:hypothetical protein
MDGPLVSPTRLAIPLVVSVLAIFWLLVGTVAFQLM